MWPFRRKTWTARQKKFRRDCRWEEKELEKLANFLHIDANVLKTVQEPIMTQQATPAPTHPDETKEDPSTAFPEALAHEFDSSGDPKGDACCIHSRSCGEMYEKDNNV